MYGASVMDLSGAVRAGLGDILLGPCTYIPSEDVVARDLPQYF